VGWYRIAYRIETSNAPPLNGILSIGAIAPDLLTLRLALPEQLVTGKPLTVRVYAGNPVTRRSFRGVRLEGTLKYDGEPTKGAKPFSRTIVRAAITGSSGEAVLVYPIQGAPGDTATLTVKGTFTGEDGAQSKSSIDADVEIRDQTTIHIDTDKPLHKPGEPVHLRALVFGSTGGASANSPLTLTIKDPENKTLLEVPLTTNRFGIASYDWKTGAQLASGDYEATFDLADSSDYPGSMTTLIAVRRYDLPEFSVSASMDRGFYLDGQTPVVRLHAGYLFGKPVPAGAVRIVRAEKYQWNRTAKKSKPEKAEQTATLDEHGDAELKLNVQDDFSDFKTTDYERYRDIEYRAYVTDVSTGRTEPRNFTVRLTRYAVHIYLNRMGGNDREGDYIVDTAYADGVPAACKVSLDWMDADSPPSHAASISTNRYGVARVHLRYPSAAAGDESPRFNLRLSARDAEQRTSIFDETVDADGPKSIWLSVAATLMKPGQNIEAIVHGTPGSLIDVDAMSEQGVLNHQQVHMLHAAEPVTVLMGDEFRGFVTLIAYSMDGERHCYGHSSWCGWSAHKTVLYPEDRELKLKLSGLRTSYAPGSSVDAGLDVRTATGFAAPGALGVAVIDTAVEQRAATEEDADQRWFAWNQWRDPANNISGVTYQNLARADMSQPVSDDLQLVAEAGLQYSIPVELKIESEDLDDVRSDLSDLMQKQLKPIADAVLAARPARLPGTPDAVRDLANAAALEPALLLDPWDTPYRVKAAVESNDEVLSMVSAGPDKRFGTEDDFTIDVARRNLFALPGERLTKLLRDAVASGKKLPGTVDGVKQLARAGGLDLDATLDPDGNPFQYQIEVGRRFYSVHVFRHDTQVQANGRLEGSPAWSSPSIDYFSHTEAQMDAALAQ
jgi:hypothetical protein